MGHMPGFGAWICLFFILFVAGIAVLIVLLTRNRNTPTPQGFQPIHAPAQYVIRGVDKATRADKTFRVTADSEANARVKAELEGMIVTSVQFESYV